MVEDKQTKTDNTKPKKELPFGLSKSKAILLGIVAGVVVIGGITLVTINTINDNKQQEVIGLNYNGKTTGKSSSSASSDTDSSATTTSTESTESTSPAISTSTSQLVVDSGTSDYTVEIKYDGQETPKTDSEYQELVTKKSRVVANSTDGNKATAEDLALVTNALVEKVNSIQHTQTMTTTSEEYFNALQSIKSAFTGTNSFTQNMYELIIRSSLGVGTVNVATKDDDNNMLAYDLILIDTNNGNQLMYLTGYYHKDTGKASITYATMLRQGQIAMNNFIESRPQAAATN